MGPGLRARAATGLCALGIGLAGTAFVVGLVLGMNGSRPTRPDGDGAGAVSFAVPPPPPRKPPARKKARPKPKRSARQPPPAPVVGAHLSGLDLGLDAFAMAGDDEARALLGELDDVVMTSESVDSLPRPSRQVAPDYPERARRQGLSGSVELRLMVGVDGAVREVEVLSAQPPGVFDQAAVAAVRQWRFQPATYEGRPVAIRVTQTLRFGFD